MHDIVSFQSASLLLRNQHNLDAQAAGLFNQALQNRVLHRLRGLLHRRVHLLNLNRIADQGAVRASHFAGQRVVPIDHIRGTEGRCTDFDAGFRPLSERSRLRWVHLAIARLNGESLPPVELIEVGGTYFVRDGHHRISVAKALGQQTIDAEVTVWETAAPLNPWKMA